MKKANINIKQPKILIVDDEDIILNTLTADLTDHGYNVLSASSGERGLIKLNRENVNLVITDLSLEGMNGIEMLNQTKKINPHIAVIILTGYGSMDTAVEALRLGADDYLLKPCNLEELLFRISSCLQKQEMANKIKIYENILPVCCICKKIRDDTGKIPGEGKWVDPDIYLATRTNVDITHGYCPKCYEKTLKTI